MTELSFVILCGGSGSRLWPKSREKLPKQLLALTNGKTMLQDTIERVQTAIKKIGSTRYKIYVICNADHAHIVEKQTENACVQIITEPKGRDSAPAICIASLLTCNDTITFVLPCDHIFDDAAFANCCLKAVDVLYYNQAIVTFGIKPTRPETGYGYIKYDSITNNTVEFFEKPLIEFAERYVEAGNYLWNAGVFAFKNGNMIECFSIFAPDILDSCVNTIGLIVNTTSSTISLPSSFSECRAISVDYAIMEPLTRKLYKTYVVPMTIRYNSYWNDIGSFSALYDELLHDTDVDNNVKRGDVISWKTKGCYIDSAEGLVATVGVQDLIIVNSGDAVLVCDKSSAQDVKKIVDQLKRDKREESAFHKKVFRPWGWYKNVEGGDSDGFKIKRIAVYPGKRLSLQSHNKRAEHWVIVRGKAKVQVGEDILILEKDQHVYIPTLALHRIENIGDDLMEFTETQVGDYLGEDDIIRYEDDFGRV
jgi:mannose-1-phosphate guanylyltransferase/mannose-6-phosphate isomerase